MALKFSAVPLYKVTATGNDFLLIDLRTASTKARWRSQFGRQSRPEIVRDWCARHLSVGADGVVFLEKAPKVDFRWDFYNADGSVAEMCGNAARAVALYLFEANKKKKIRFQSLAGLIEVTTRNQDEITVQMPRLGAMEWNCSSKIGSFDFVHSGVPHAVVEVQSLNQSELKIRALALREEPRFQAEGINVTFVEKLSDRAIRSVTFERGVNDFTLSCGTGAVAAAAKHLKGKDGEVEVQVPGGQLRVAFKDKQPVLTGSARIVAKLNPILPSRRKWRK